MVSSLPTNLSLPRVAQAQLSDTPKLPTLGGWGGRRDQHWLLCYELYMKHFLNWNLEHTPLIEWWTHNFWTFVYKVDLLFGTNSPCIPSVSYLLSHELNQYNISMAGFCLTRWSSTGKMVINCYHCLWSGPSVEDGSCVSIYSVALALSGNACKTLMRWSSISEHIVVTRLSHRHPCLYTH